jgi:hypothetical protein
MASYDNVTPVSYASHPYLEASQHVYGKPTNPPEKHKAMSELEREERKLQDLLKQFHSQHHGHKDETTCCDIEVAVRKILLLLHKTDPMQLSVDIEE